MLFKGILYHLTAYSVEYLHDFYPVLTSKRTRLVQTLRLFGHFKHLL